MKVALWSPFCLVVLSAISLLGRESRASVYVVDQAAPGAADTNSGAEENPVQDGSARGRPGQARRHRLCYGGPV